MDVIKCEEGKWEQGVWVQNSQSSYECTIFKDLCFPLVWCKILIGTFHVISVYGNKNPFINCGCFVEGNTKLAFVYEICSFTTSNIN